MHCFTIVSLRVRVDDVYMVRTQANNDEPVKIYNRRGFFEFEVQACSLANIRLVKTPAEEFYTVVLGTCHHHAFVLGKPCIVVVGE